MGLLRDQEISEEHKSFLLKIQTELFSVGAIMATPNDNQKRLNIQKVKPESIEALELEIDRMDEELPQMTHFILPGGHPIVSYCHVARSVCRRSERLAYELNHFEPLDAEVLQYLNRLSDYLFVLARKLSKEKRVEEVKWIPEKGK